eukprot:5915971-Pleurochrysis_carterae.AAC.1
MDVRCADVIDVVADDVACSCRSMCALECMMASLLAWRHSSHAKLRRLLLTNLVRRAYTSGAVSALLHACA